MPSLITHYSFAKDVLNKLPEHIKINDINTYSIFSESHDILFYNFNKNIKKIGHLAHHNNTQEYILNIIKNIKYYKFENTPQIIEYLYGTITHYVLDTTCHPYIFYKTGTYKKTKETKKYKGKHNELERQIDAIYYEKQLKKEYKTSDINKEIIKKIELNNKLIFLIDKAYEETYNVKNMGVSYKKSIKDMRFISRLIFKDKYGLKLPIYKLIDKLSNNKIYSYSNHIKPNLKYINDKTIWYHPVTKEKHQETFEELYDIAVEKAIFIIKEIYKIIYEHKDIEDLKSIIKNLDYSTGLEEKSKMKYFAY